MYIGPIQHALCGVVAHHHARRSACTHSCIYDIYQRAVSSSRPCGHQPYCIMPYRRCLWTPFHHVLHICTYALAHRVFASAPSWSLPDQHARLIVCVYIWVTDHRSVMVVFCAHCCGSQPLRHIADKPSVIALHYSATSVVSQPSRPSACARVHSGPL